MRCDAKNEDPQWLYEDYIKDLILVSRCGNSDTRYLFLLRYAEQLYGLTNYLAFLSKGEQRAVFDDALRSSAGNWPRSFAGMRLAAPPWFRRRVRDPLSVWKTSASYNPDRLEIDPICGMIVDPSETPYSSRRDGVDVYFCCLACRERFEQRVDGMDPPSHPAAA